MVPPDHPPGSCAYRRRTTLVAGHTLVVVTSDPPIRPAPPQVRTAGALVTVQGLIGVGVALVLGVGTASSDIPVGAVLAQAGLFVVIGLALVGIGVGLVTGRRWARSPAIVTQLLLLPVAYSLIGPSRQLLLGVLTGVYVAATFLLLISERSRAWSMGLDLPDAPTRPPGPRS